MIRHYEQGNFKKEYLSWDLQFQRDQGFHSREHISIQVDRNSATAICENSHFEVEPRGRQRERC